VGVYERHTLDNGIRVLTAPMPHAQSVSCFVMLAAGSRYETPETNGIAHFAEHMFFKGTERRPNSRAISSEIDGIGGEFNAFTGKEYTGYYVKCAAETRDTALDVLVDMLRRSLFDPDEIEREKGVIVEEMNMYYDTPRDFIGGVYDQLLYGDQPLGWDIIGRKETVRAATRETFLGYVDQWYKPERMVVPPLPGRAQLPARAPRPVRATAALDRARHGDVVATLHGGARAARPRLLRLRG
jgi:predicted Zn-dependent peptidase